MDTNAIPRKMVIVNPEIKFSDNPLTTSTLTTYQKCKVSSCSYNKWVCKGIPEFVNFKVDNGNTVFTYFVLCEKHQMKLLALILLQNWKVIVLPTNNKGETHND